MRSKIKFFLKNLASTLIPQGIRINFYRGFFRIQAKFWGYRNFGTEHNSHWNRCLKECEGKVFFDIGAHIGLYSLPALQVAKQVVAFEPSTYNLREFQHNLRLNKTHFPLVLEPIVLGNTVGEISFYESQNQSHPKSSLLASSSSELIAKRKKCTTLDAYCLEKKLYPEVIKIDVEGAEFLVLEGAKKILSERKPTVYLSLHPRLIKDLNYELKWLKSFTSSINYEVYPASFELNESLNEVILVPAKM